MGADIHFVIEHNNPKDNLGWVGVYQSDASYSPPNYNRAAFNALYYNLPEEERRRRMDAGVHPFGLLSRRDYEFFSRLAGVRGDGPVPNGVPPDASAMTRRTIARWERSGHSHGHMPLREFIKRKIINDNSLVEVTKTRLQGIDPIVEYLKEHVCELDDITLDDNTRVVFFFDN
jgi:hypothetical protein